MSIHTYDFVQLDEMEVAVGPQCVKAIAPQVILKMTRSVNNIEAVPIQTYDIARIELDSGGDSMTEAYFVVGGQLIFKTNSGVFDFSQLMASEYFPSSLLRWHEIQLYVVADGGEQTMRAKVTATEPHIYPDDLMVGNKPWLIDCRAHEGPQPKVLNWHDQSAYHNKLTNNPWNNSIVFLSKMCGLTFSN